MATSGSQCAAFECRSGTIKNKNRLGAQEQELADASEEPKQVTIVHHLSLLITHGLNELYHPYARIYLVAIHHRTYQLKLCQNMQFNLWNHSDLFDPLL
jgi:hypothetical protein